MIADMQRRLDEHDKLLTNGEEQFRLILQLLNDNTHAINKLDRSTSGVVKAYRDVQGAATVGTAVWNFCLWCLRGGAYLAALGFAIAKIIEYFNHASPPGP